MQFVPLVIHVGAKTGRWLTSQKMWRIFRRVL